MRTLKLIAVVMVFILSSPAIAQVSVSVNIGSPPQWGPEGFTEVRYYYLPDVEAYYDIRSSMFIYYGGGVWVHTAYLPEQYRGYDLYNGYKVVMTDYHGDTPYHNFAEYKRKYAKGYHGRSQRTIGERPGNGNSGRETISKDHPNKQGSHGSNKKIERNGYIDYSHGNSKNKQNDHGHGGGKGRK